MIKAMKRSDPLWGQGPEYEKPEDIESEAERMRRLNKAFQEDYRMLFNALFGSSLPEIKQ
jgi:hypothetical protein